MSHWSNQKASPKAVTWLKDYQPSTLVAKPVTTHQKEMKKYTGLMTQAKTV